MEIWGKGLQMKQQDCDLKVEEHTQDIGKCRHKRAGGNGGIDPQTVKNQLTRLLSCMLQCSFLAQCTILLFKYHRSCPCHY
jgi:hypothetical protein